ncbi:hypothetical protein KSP39_PZI006936 [Platanthera zijinensis]|uniref:Uncharacterized protein n=1 Tax=Platanthera zijinensis TaxID=2320716 RepID=A0AAP0BQR3_9ASPA
MGQRPPVKYCYRKGVRFPQYGFPCTKGLCNNACRIRMVGSEVYLDRHYCIGEFMCRCKLCTSTPVWTEPSQFWSPLTKLSQYGM